MSNNKKELSEAAAADLLLLLKKRFEKHPERHKDIRWGDVEMRLLSSPEKLWSLDEMEVTGGEPDVVGYDPDSDAYLFFDCSPESPKGRRSTCYDRAGWESRKEHRPAHTAIDMAGEMGIDMLDEQQYRYLQTLGEFDLKTSSWLLTPAAIRKLDGAIFGDRRYGQVFVYHNGAQSYYAARGFRGVLKV